MVQEKCSFTVTYSGDPEVIRAADFSESLSGVEGVIKHAYTLINGDNGEVVVTTSERESPVDTDRTFEVTVIAAYQKRPVKTVMEIIELIGFNNSTITKKDMGW